MIVMNSPIELNKKEVLEKLKKNKKTVDKFIEKYLPKPEKCDYDFLVENFGKTEYKYDLEAFKKAFLEPAWDFLERGGKRWRPFLFVLVYEALGGKKEDILDLLIIPELLHNGSVIIDDIEDNSDLRRGKPCLHKIYGIDIAINIGNMLYFYPFLSLVKNVKDPSVKSRLYDMILTEMVKLHLGQGTDIYWHKGLKNPVVEEYLEMCANKTGGLARLSVKMAAILAGKDDETVEKLGKVAESIGIAFQIQDDIINLKSKEFQKLKGFGEDITEGKRSLMVIYTLGKANKNDKKRLLEILDKHTTDPEEIKEAVEIMEKYNAFDFAKNKAREIIESAWKEAEPLLLDNEAKILLKNFIEYLIYREI